MMLERDDHWAEPPVSARDLLGDAAAPMLTYVEGDIYARNGVWTEAQWRPRSCTCGGTPRMPNDEIPDLDFRDGVPPPDGCRCHLDDEDRFDWLALGGWEDGPRALDVEGCRVGLGACSARHEKWAASIDVGDAGLDRPWVDIYFSAGKRANWSRIGDDLVSFEGSAPTDDDYRSCDDGNDRSCELWRLRWYFDTASASVVEKVVAREDLGREDWEPIALTRPAVSPDGRYLTYGYREFHHGNTFDDQSFEAVRVMEIGGPRSDDNEVAWALPWGGGAGWPAWVDDATLVIGNEMSLANYTSYDVYYGGTKYTKPWRLFNASFKTVQQVPLVDTGRGMEADGDPFPIRGPGVRYQYLDYKPLEAESQVIATMGVATDPHAHADAKYGPHDRRGLRVASFGNRHNEDLGDAATTVVFDPTLDDPFGDAAETFQKPPETYDGDDESVAGLHHPTWNITGDMVQCSHQQSTVDINAGLTSRRGLHGFKWDEDSGEWVPWNAGVHPLWTGQGRLFPNNGWDRAYNSDTWWAGLPATLEASSEGLPWWFPEEVTSGHESEERCAIYVWKYGAFCGSDDYVVAQLACNNAAWAATEFVDALNKVPADQAESRRSDLTHLAQLASRVVLIRLSDGYHWDLTSIVESALSSGGTPFPTVRLYGLFPTCGALHGILPGRFSL